MSAVEDVYDYLLAEGLAGTSDWDLIRRRITDAPVQDQCVVVQEDGGPVPEMGAAAGMGDAAMADVGVLVHVRAKQWDADVSALKARAIYVALHGQFDVALGASGATTTYLRVRAMTAEPIFLGYDEKGRPQHTIAFRMLRLA